MPSKYTAEENSTRVIFRKKKKMGLKEDGWRAKLIFGSAQMEKKNLKL